MFNLDGQMNQFKQQAARAGFSGSAILDVRPVSGVIRMKLNTASPEMLKPFTENFSQALATMLGGLNIQVKVHVEQDR